MGLRAVCADGMPRLVRSGGGSAGGYYFIPRNMHHAAGMVGGMAVLRHGSTGCANINPWHIDIEKAERIIPSMQDDVF